MCISEITGESEVIDFRLLVVEATQWRESRDKPNLSSSTCRPLGHLHCIDRRRLRIHNRCCGHTLIECDKMRDATTTLHLHTHNGTAFDNVYDDFLSVHVRASHTYPVVTRVITRSLTLGKASKHRTVKKMGFLGRFMSSVVVPVVVGILAYRYGHLVVDRLDWEPIEVFCRERIGIKIFDLSKEESVATQKDEGKGPKEKIIIEDQGKVVVLDKKKIMEEKEEAEKKAKAAEREQEDAAKVADKREEDKDHEDGVKKAKKTYRKGDPRNCCHKLRIEGTKIDDPWYRNIMGEYTFFPELR